MKVKDILKKYSMASNASITIEVTTGDAKGLHTIGKSAIDRLLEEKAPIVDKTVGLIYVIDNTLRITAY